MNSSLSLTLDAFYTETTVIFDAHYSEDVFILDGILQNENKQKVKEFLNLVRQQADCTWFAKWKVKILCLLQLVWLLQRVV